MDEGKTQRELGIATRLLLVGLFLQAVLAAPGLFMRPGGKTVFEKDTAYQRIVVEDDEASGMRLLVFDRTLAVQSAIKPEKPEELVLPYVRTIASVVLALEAEPRRSLIVGFGGGTLSGFVAKTYPSSEVHSLDIDGELFDVGRRYFGYIPGAAARLIAEDARTFLRRGEEGRYDLIVLDAYAGTNIPEHLVTREFFREVKKRLSPGGVVVANLFSGVRADSKKNDMAALSYLRTMEEELGGLLVLRTDGGRSIVAASGLSTEKLSRNWEMSPPSGNEEGRYDVRQFTEEDRREYQRRGLLLTDDFVPINHLRSL